MDISQDNLDDVICPQFFECPVCFEKLTEQNKTLPCQHTFCIKCLEKLFESKNQLKCPECNLIVDKKLDELVPNLWISRILSEAERWRQRKQAQEEDLILKKHPCARAINDFLSNEPNQLKFKKGDLIILKENFDSEIYYGKCNNSEGIFSQIFVEIINPLPSKEPLCISLHQFNNNQLVHNKEQYLSFSKNEIITVIRKIDESWLEGCLKNKIGMFPLVYVKLNETAKELIEKQSFRRKTFTFDDDQIKSTSSNHINNELSKVREKVFNFAISDNSTTNENGSSIKSYEYLYKGSSTQTKNLPGFVFRNDNRLENERNNFKVPQNTNNFLVSKHNTSGAHVEPITRQQAKILDNKLTNQFSDSIDSNENNAKVELVTTNCETKLKKRVVKKPHSDSIPIYIAQYTYFPKKSDELALIKGKHYVVTEKCHDGWFKGYALDTNKSGVFPGNYVTLSLNCLNKHNQKTVLSSHAAEGPSTSQLTNGVHSQKSQLVTLSSKQKLGTDLLANKQFVSNNNNSTKLFCTTASSSSSTKTNHILTKQYSLRSKYKSSKEKSTSEFKKPLQETSNALNNRSTYQNGNISIANEIATETKEIAQLRHHHHRKSNSLDAGRHSIDSKMQTSKSNNGNSSSNCLSKLQTMSKLLSTPDKLGERYICITPYPRNSDLELDLAINDIIYVVKKRDDGWLKGLQLRTGEIGLFPSNFVEHF